jgi:hypothetical protein
LADVKRGASRKLRLSDDGETIRVIKPAFPEADDDTPVSDRSFSGKNLMARASAFPAGAIYVELSSMFCFQS